MALWDVDTGPVGRGILVYRLRIFWVLCSAPEVLLNHLLPQFLWWDLETTAWALYRVPWVVPWLLSQGVRVYCPAGRHHCCWRVLLTWNRGLVCLGKRHMRINGSCVFPTWKLNPFQWVTKWISCEAVQIYFTRLYKFCINYWRLNVSGLQKII